MSYIGNTQQNQSFVPAIDYFSGNGSTTAFTLSRAPGSTYAIEVVVNNVQQNPSTAFTVSGSTLTFTSAPSTGSNNIYVYYNSPNIQVIAPSAGTVQSSSIASGGPTWDASGNVTVYNGANISAGNTFGFKNRIINGAMVIDQRNAGASFSPTTSTAYGSCDRWGGVVSQNSKLTMQQNAGSVTPPAGFTNYMGITSSSAYSILSTDYFNLRQNIEGFNVADLGWGAAGASSVTISFWVRSSLTGTFGAAVANSAYNRSYPFNYTISSANTWEQKTVTIPGDTSGTWLTNNGTGITVNFGLGVGSSWSGTANTWASATYNAPTGATSVVGTSGATFYITGVQLEKGSVATPFDFRDYGRELRLCQRYYWVICNGDNQSISNASAWAASEVNCIIQHPVSMRASPTLSSTSGTAYYNFRSNGGGQTFTTLNLIETNTLLTRLYSSTVSTTSGAAGYLKTNSASAFAALTAEL